VSSFSPSRAFGQARSHRLGTAIQFHLEQIKAGFVRQLVDQNGLRSAGKSADDEKRALQMGLFCRTGLGKLQYQILKFRQRFLPGNQRQGLSFGTSCRQPVLQPSHDISLTVLHPAPLNCMSPSGSNLPIPPVCACPWLPLLLPVFFPNRQLVFHCPANNLRHRQP